MTGRFTRHTRTPLRWVAVVAALPISLGAQTLTLKRPPLTPVSVACPQFATPPAPVRQQLDEANRLATLGEESSLEGDHRAAHDLFTQAAALNPRDATVAYRTAREDEALGQRDDAARQYCRYLALGTSASDAARVTQHVTELLSPADMTRGKEVVRAFGLGVTDFDARDWPGAAREFSEVLAKDSTLFDALYNRALAEDRGGDRSAAIHDYTRYLQANARDADAPAVRIQVQALRNSIPSAGTAFGLGLLPGGGQFYTGQPVLGIAVIAVAAAGVAWAVQTQTVTRDTVYVGPFGGTYPGTYTQTQRPHLALGIGAAAGVTVLGAIEAALVAHGRGAGLSDAEAAPLTRSALLPHAGPVTMTLPTLQQAPDGMRWAMGLSIAVR
jgi:tetratricopeptide (TPR) repeat protein